MQPSRGQGGLSQLSLNRLGKNVSLFKKRDHAIEVFEGSAAMLETFEEKCLFIKRSIVLPRKLIHQIWRATKGEKRPRNFAG